MSNFHYFFFSSRVVHLQHCEYMKIFDNLESAFRKFSLNKTMTLVIRGLFDFDFVYLRTFFIFESSNFFGTFQKYMLYIISDRNDQISEKAEM